MKGIGYAAAMATLGLGGGAGAQSLEETYANLCSDEAAAKSETCVTLRSGLIAKLTEQNSTRTTAVPTVPAGSAEPAVATIPALDPAIWGIYAHLVGKNFIASGAPGFNIATYTYKDGVVHITSNSYSADGKYGPVGMRTTITPQADGRLLAESDWGKPKTVHWTVLPDGSVESEIKKKKKVTIRFLEGKIVSFRPKEEPHASVEITKQEATQRVAAWQQMKQQRAAAKSNDGGLFGSLVGAAVGAYAGAAGGLDTGETVGAVMKGMSITNPNSPMAAALSSTGDQLLTGGGATSALASGVGGAASGGGSYPTKPNLATGACSGFTEGNYRTKALEGGGDSQLNTMCGQAFEYYTMYKRAIVQGYSEADANRTYAAHEQSARVASGYLSSHGAN